MSCVDVSSLRPLFALLALSGVHREYPNKIGHALLSDVDGRSLRQLTPAFFGCFECFSQFIWQTYKNITAVRKTLRGKLRGDFQQRSYLTFHPLFPMRWLFDPWLSPRNHHWCRNNWKLGPRVNILARPRAKTQKIIQSTLTGWSKSLILKKDTYRFLLKIGNVLNHLSACTDHPTTASTVLSHFSHWHPDLSSLKKMKNDRKQFQTHQFNMRLRCHYTGLSSMCSPAVLDIWCERHRIIRLIRGPS